MWLVAAMILGLATFGILRTAFGIGAFFALVLAGIIWVAGRPTKGKTDVGAASEPRLYFDDPRVEPDPITVWEPRGGVAREEDRYTGGTGSAPSTSVLFPRMDPGGEAFYIAHLSVVNADDSPGPAERVEVQLDFPGPGGRFSFPARWVDAPQLIKDFDTYEASEKWTRLNPGQKRSVDIAAKHPTDRVAYAYGNKTTERWRFMGERNVRHEPYRLVGSQVRVKAKITADNLVKPHEEWFLLSGLDEQGPLGFTRLVEDGTQAG